MLRLRTSGHVTQSNVIRFRMAYQCQQSDLFGGGRGEDFRSRLRCSDGSQRAETLRETEFGGLMTPRPRVDSTTVVRIATLRKHQNGAPFEHCVYFHLCRLRSSLSLLLQKAAFEHHPRKYMHHFLSANHLLIGHLRPLCIS